MDGFLVSTGVVALAEIGDKTQLLAFLLAARFKKPLPIVLGILLATLVNHGLAGALGAWITSAVSPTVLRWILGLGFIAMAAWTLVPDSIEDEEASVASRFGVFGATLITFFLAEMRDRGDGHVGDKLADRIPMKLVHGIAAAIFAALGIATLLGVGARLGF